MTDRGNTNADCLLNFFLLFFLRGLLYLLRLAFYSIFSRALSPGFNFHKKTRPLPERRTLKRALEIWCGVVGCFSRCFFEEEMQEQARGKREMCPKNQISAFCALRGL